MVDLVDDSKLSCPLRKDLRSAPQRDVEVPFSCRMRAIARPFTPEIINLPSLRYSIGSLPGI